MVFGAYFLRRGMKWKFATPNETREARQKKIHFINHSKTFNIMISYKIVEKKKPGTQDFKYYGQISTVKPMGIRELCKKVAHATTATPSDVKAVIDAMEYEIVEAVKDGKSVRLGTLGSFRPTISSEGAESEATFAANMIKSVNVRFTQGAEMKKALKLGAGSEVTFCKE